MKFSDDIKQKALQLGFDLVGITDATAIPDEQIKQLKDWLRQGCAGQMNYMYKNLEKRINPANLLQNAKSVICLGLNYKPPVTKAETSKLQLTTAKVAAFALYEDYHLFIKKLLRKLVKFISQKTDKNFKFKICVDSVPLAERALAERAGLGFIGKNHMLINPRIGPAILLAEIITDLKLESDKPLAEKCSACDKCITACPTSALSPTGRFDANKCISYLTIEHKTKISPNLTAKISNHLFGCDECILACPYHKNAPSCTNKQFKFHPETENLDLNEILKMSPAQFETKFADSPIGRPGLEKLKQNARICQKNIESRKNAKM